MSATSRPPASMAEWQRRYLALHGAATRIQAARRRHAERVCQRAGICELMLLHNALVAEHRGKPWRGVDYPLAHQAAAIAASRFEGFGVLDRWGERYPLRELARARAATQPLTLREDNHDCEPRRDHRDRTHAASNHERR